MDRVAFGGCRRVVVVVVVLSVGLACASGAVAAARWSVQVVPELAGFTVGGLSGVSCPSRVDCFAVGEELTSSSAQVREPLVERWNGSSWAPQQTPALPPGWYGSFNAVSCASGTACVAVGEMDSYNSGGQPLVEIWDGSSWSIQPSLAPADSFFTAASCSSASDCTAVGISGSSSTCAMLAGSWNGERWAPQPIGYRCVGLSELWGVSCVASSACVAVGDDDIGDCSGTYQNDSYSPVVGLWRRAWSLQRILHPSCRARRGPGESLRAVSCTSIRACTAVGTGPGGQLAERWHRGRWSIEPTPRVRDSLLNGVSCFSQAVCTSAGAHDGGQLIERWHRGRWSIEPTPRLHGSFLYGVSCTSRTVCMAVGVRFRRTGETPLAEVRSQPRDESVRRTVSGWLAG
jgi:hypothetical protein